MTNRMGNPAPLGLLAFGMTTLMLMYVEMGWVETDFQAIVYGTAVFFGGLGQFLVAIFELIQGSSFSFAVFGSYAFFWLAWAAVFVERQRTTSIMGDFEYKDGMTAFFIQWGVLTSCFWVITWRKNIALITIFFLLSVTFFLLAIANATGEEAVKKTAGFFGFMTACGAFYTGIAELVNEEWGRSILPGLTPILLPSRMVVDNETIAKCISYDKPSNTLMLYFKGLHITTPEAVEAVINEVEKAILAARAPNNKVHVIVDYKDAVIAKAVVQQYWQAAQDLENRYYLSVSRFAVSSFGTSQMSARSLNIGTHVTHLDGLSHAKVDEHHQQHVASTMASKEFQLSKEFQPDDAKEEKIEPPKLASENSEETEELKV